MRVLVLWRRGQVDKIRNSEADHIFCMENYDKENEYFYFNIFNGRYDEDYKWIEEGMFDAVIIHYTAINLRFTERLWIAFVQLMERVLKNKSCLKILVTQDDYTNTQAIWQLSDAINADKIYTIIRKEDYDILYPKDKFNRPSIETILTGYIDEKYIIALDYVPHNEREYDVVYRAQKNAFIYGKHGNLKYEIAELFLDKLSGMDMKTNIMPTNGNQNVLHGDDWLKFIMSSRLTIGCLGGSGMVHYNLELFRKIIAYSNETPDASYDEVKAALFPDVKEELHGIISPRVFECAITHTCQVLVGNDYHGILTPDIDYIMLKNDFSNIDEVIEKMKDVNYCEKVAQTCYENVVGSNKYTYDKLAKKISQDIKNMIRTPHNDSCSSDYIKDKCDENNKKVMAEMIEYYSKR